MSESGRLIEERLMLLCSRCGMKVCCWAEGAESIVSESTRLLCKPCGAYERWEVEVYEDPMPEWDWKYPTQTPMPIVRYEVLGVDENGSLVRVRVDD